MMERKSVSLSLLNCVRKVDPKVTYKCTSSTLINRRTRLCIICDIVPFQGSRKSVSGDENMNIVLFVEGDSSVSVFETFFLSLGVRMESSWKDTTGPQMSHALSILRA